MSEFLPVSQPSSASDANEIVILEEGVLTPEEVARVLDPVSMTE